MKKKLFFGGLILFYFFSLLGQPISKTTKDREYLSPPFFHLFNSGKELFEIFSRIDSFILSCPLKRNISAQMLLISDAQDIKVIQLYVDTINTQKDFRLIKKSSKSINITNKTEIIKCERQIDKQTSELIYELIKNAVLKAQYSQDSSRLIVSHTYYFLFKDPFFGNELVGMTQKQNTRLPILMERISQWMEIKQEDTFPKDIKDEIKKIIAHLIDET